MIQNFLRLIFFLNLILFGDIASANESQSSAKVLIARIKMYNYALDSIKAITSSSGDSVERDLSLCLVIGNATEGTGNLAIASWNLRDNILDETDREELDNLGGKQVTLRGAMQRFCINSDPSEYRSAQLLLSKVSETDTILIKLKKLAEKYL